VIGITAIIHQMLHQSIIGVSCQHPVHAGIYSFRIVTGSFLANIFFYSSGGNIGNLILPTSSRVTK
jgi:hypothetical protein